MDRLALLAMATSVFAASIIWSNGWATAAEPLTTDSTSRLPPIEMVSIGENREFLVNGKPFLPIMSWLQSAQSYPKLRELGINTYCGTSTRQGAKEHCESAKAAGGYAVAGFGRNEGAIGHPHLLAWIHGDEPDMPDEEGNPRSTVESVVAHFKSIREADQSRPVFVTFTGGFIRQERSQVIAEKQKELYSGFVNACDVAGFDIYPIYGSGHPSRLNWPAYGTAQLREYAGPKRPVYAWIETSKGSQWMTYEKQPDVLPKHTRFEVWGVLIEGATAYGYFTHAWRPEFKEFSPTAQMQAELKRLNAQVTRLSGAILATATDKAVTMKLAGDLKCHLKATEYDGSLYIFAQNQDLGPGGEEKMQFEPVSPRSARATFTVGGLKAGTTIEVVGEERAIKAADGGRFGDEFDGLAEHIYRIKM